MTKFQNNWTKFWREYHKFVAKGQMPNAAVESAKIWAKRELTENIQWILKFMKNPKTEKIRVEIFIAHNEKTHHNNV